MSVGLITCLRDKRLNFTGQGENKVVSGPCGPMSPEKVKLNLSNVIKICRMTVGRIKWFQGQTA